jgi:hypothetical protein
MQLLRGLPWSVGNNARAGMAESSRTPPFFFNTAQLALSCVIEQPGQTKNVAKSLTSHPRGVPESRRSPWHIPRDDAASPDYGVVSNRDAG